QLEVDIETPIQEMKDWIKKNKREWGRPPWSMLPLFQQQSILKNRKYTRRILKLFAFSPNWLFWWVKDKIRGFRGGNGDTRGAPSSGPGGLILLKPEKKTPPNHLQRALQDAA